MPSSRLHPSQIRSSCERCRRHKLRCVREPPTANICTNCTRLSSECLSGQQRKVGRPSTKRSKDLVAVRRSPSPVLVDIQPDAPADEQLPSTALQAETEDFGWMFEDAMHFFSNSNVGQAFTSFNESTIVPELFLPSKDALITINTPDMHFSTLSKLNVRLNAAFNLFAEAEAKGVSLDGLVWGLCIDEVPQSKTLGKHGLKVLLETAQDFLDTIRAIHRKVGITVQSMPNSLATPGPSEQILTFQKIDTPTAFLVISCFTQILKLYELVYIIITQRFRRETTPPNQVAFDCTAVLKFADVSIVNFTAKLNLLCELSRLAFTQIILVLGIPGAHWPGRTIWNGLLQDEKYREMLNDELGSVEGLWSRRPAKLLSMMDRAREVILIESMVDYM